MSGAGSRPTRVLVVDDNADLARSTVLLLGLEGYDTRAAHSGTAALAEAAAFRPDVVLLDLRLPDVSGIDVARRLRAECGPGVVLFAVSGLEPEDRPEAASAPGLFDGHLVKPVDLAGFTRTLEEVRTGA